MPPLRQRVQYSRPRGAIERLLIRCFPIAFHRCHDCNWRSWRILRHPTAFARYALSLGISLLALLFGTAAITAGVWLLIK